MRSAPGPAVQRGFTYLGVLLLTLLLSLTAAVAGAVWQLAAQRERERELLFVGQQYRDAIEQYLRRTPPGTSPVARRLPRQLADLLQDPRFPGTVRHLRRAYPDPMGPAAEWGLLRSVDGGIAGVYSTVARVPIKRSNFPAGMAFANARSYRDWRFVAPSAVGMLAASTEPRTADAAGPAASPSALPSASPAPSDSSAADLPAADEPPAVIVPPTPRQQDFRRRDPEACARIAAYDRWQCALQLQNFGQAAAIDCQTSASQRAAVCPFVADGPLPALFLRNR